MIYFDIVTKIRQLAVKNELSIWHVKHGWCYLVRDYSQGGRVIGQFYVTLLPGGGVLHFDAVDPCIPPASILAAFRKGVRIVRPHLGLILATIPTDKNKLIRVVRRLGFIALPNCDYQAGPTRYRLLKYLNL